VKWGRWRSGSPIDLEDEEEEEEDLRFTHIQQLETYDLVNTTSENYNISNLARRWNRSDIIISRHRLYQIIRSFSLLSKALADNSIGKAINVGE
jgi:hypothetical protein